MMTRLAPFTVLIAFTALGAEPGLNVLALETNWRTEAGASVSLAARKNTTYALAFVYTSCPTTCPLTTQKLKKLDAAQVKAGKPIDIVVVSLDPGHDTPAAIAEYRAKHGLAKAERFHVLVGSETEVRTLTMLLGFRYARNAETGTITHDNSVFLIGPSGDVVTTMSSLDSALAPFVDAVKLAPTRR